jgi:chromosome segregation ATPase
MLSMDNGGLFQGVLFAGGSVVVLVLGVFVWAIVMLFRRREGARSSAAAGLAELSIRANVLLVRADDAVKAADDELGFAVAQFDEERTADFAKALDNSRTKLTTAFRLQKELDDAIPESVQQRREWTLQIIAFSEMIIEELEKQDRGFSALRNEEVDAPARLTDLQRDIHSASARIPGAKATLERLANDFITLLSANLTDAVTDATAHLDEATAKSNSALATVSPSGVNDVAKLLDEAQNELDSAVLRLDAIDTRASELDEAVKALAILVTTTKADLAEARTERDDAPGPDQAAAITAAIVAVEGALASSDPRSPAASLDAIGAAVSSLDAALASSRNQEERLEHATLALDGTLASLDMQLSEVSAFIAVGGSRVGPDARARLADAQRELASATAAGADPVEALDAARRAVTHLRDADALARYDAQRS